LFKGKREKNERNENRGQKKKLGEEGCTAIAQSFLGRTKERRLQKHGDDLRAISEYMQMQIFI